MQKICTIQVVYWPKYIQFTTADAYCGVVCAVITLYFGFLLFPNIIQGNTGVLLGMVLVSMVVLVALVTVMSGIGVSEHCGVGSGGIYSMISTILGGRVGGTVGLLYVFGQVSEFEHC